MKIRTFLLSLTLALASCGSEEPQPVQPPTEPSVSTEDDSNDENNDNETMNNRTITITAGEHVLTMSLADNSSARALVEKLENGDLTVEMQDYSNFEKVGALGFSLPTNDSRITTEPGDVILYQGCNFVIYYDTNTWSFTRLGKIEGATRRSLLEVLGPDNVTVILSLK